MEKSQNAIFNRTELLIGNEAMNLLTQKKVIIFGIGGVGSWTAEALIRTGITNLTLVDADKIAQSNINRQVPATTLTIGAPKAEAMRNHLLTINPNANITTINTLYTASTAEQFNLGNYDYIIDAIDSLADKHLLIINARHSSHRNSLRVSNDVQQGIDQRFSMPHNRHIRHDAGRHGHKRHLHECH